jgi:hypothetical protein
MVLSKKLETGAEEATPHKLNSQEARTKKPHWRLGPGFLGRWLLDYGPRIAHKASDKTQLNREELLYVAHLHGFLIEEKILDCAN